MKNFKHIIHREPSNWFHEFSISQWVLELSYNKMTPWVVVFTTLEEISKQFLHTFNHPVRSFDEGKEMQRQPIEQRSNQWLPATFGKKKILPFSNPTSNFVDIPESQKARKQCLPPKGKPSELRVRGSILQPNSTASLNTDKPPILYQYSRREKKNN